MDAGTRFLDQLRRADTASRAYQFRGLTYDEVQSLFAGPPVLPHAKAGTEEGARLLRQASAATRSSREAQAAAISPFSMHEALTRYGAETGRRKARGRSGATHAGAGGMDGSSRGGCGGGGCGGGFAGECSCSGYGEGTSRPQSERTISGATARGSRRCGGSSVPANIASDLPLQLNLLLWSGNPGGERHAVSKDQPMGERELEEPDNLGEPKAPWWTGFQPTLPAFLDDLIGIGEGPWLDNEEADPCPETAECAVGSMTRARSVEFETPADGGGGSDCIHVRSVSCDKPMTQYSFDCPNIEVTTERWTFDGGTANQRAVVKAAYSLLQQNMDLVAWIVCMAFGDTHIPNLKAVINTPSIVTVRFSDEVSSTLCAACGGSPDTVYFPSAPTSYVAFACPWLITFCSTDSLIKNWDKKWCCASAESRLCIVIDAAILIFHELCHVVGLQVGHDDECDAIYMAEAGLGWAMHTRFPRAGDSPCCEKYYNGTSTVNLEMVDDNVFMRPYDLNIAGELRDNCTSDC